MKLKKNILEIIYNTQIVHSWFHGSSHIERRRQFYFSSPLTRKALAATAVRKKRRENEMLVKREFSAKRKTDVVRKIRKSHENCAGMSELQLI